MNHALIFSYFPAFLIGNFWFRKASTLMRMAFVAAYGLVLSGVVSADQPDAKGLAFYEEKIRPVFIQHCYECHSERAEKAKKQKGPLQLDSAAGMLTYVVPGKPEKSFVLQSIRHDPDVKKMPPKGKLPDAVIADVEKWIRIGAPMPAKNATPPDKKKLSEQQRRHWAFQPIGKPTVPAVMRKEWVRNPIDAFVLAKLEASGLSPAVPADRATLLRRMHFDQIGLPPTPEEIERFLANEKAGEFDQLTDALLQSPHYGERWGRHWLDVVRYADSAGYEIDNFYQHAWIYRDYVIRSLNADKPFDRFIHEQIAGDELWPDSEDAKVATGFATVGPYAFEGGIARPKVVEYQRLTDLADTTGSAFLGLTVGCARCHAHKYDPISQEDYFGLQAIFAASEARPLRLKSTETKVLARRDKPERVDVLRRGEIDMPLAPAVPALFLSLPGGKTLDVSRKDEPKSRRAALAKWLTTPENPLTARVIANRIWQWHFGSGLVRTANDFGLQGEVPTHPELLDYLAGELVGNGWSLKYLHKLIMKSNTYRMSSSGQKRNLELLTHFPRRRLEAEILWDHLHAASGTLNRQMFGPAVVPPIDAKALDTLINKNWKVSDDPKQFTRRGLYLVVRRSLTLPFFETFNVSIPIESSGRRDNTVVGAQALTLLNGKTSIEQARHMAGRLLRETGNDLDKLIERAWLLAFCRPITAVEKERAREFLMKRQKALEFEDIDKLASPLGETGKSDVSKERAAAIVEWCLALFNANEFMYVD